MYRKPVFDDAHSKKLWELTKTANEIFEVRKPPVPTQEMEREYVDWLQEDLKKDPWITTRFRKLTANPKRVPWKN